MEGRRKRMAGRSLEGRHQMQTRIMVVWVDEKTNESINLASLYAAP